MPLVFSYGTLQEESVQLSTFGRLLHGQPDELPGFESSLVRIDDPRSAAPSGRTQHANVTFNGRSDSRVGGTVFDVTDAELAAADRYEQLAAYERIAATLASGKQACTSTPALRRELPEPPNHVGEPPQRSARGPGAGDAGARHERPPTSRHSIPRRRKGVRDE